MFTVLKHRSTGAAVTELQLNLTKLGYQPGVADGVYGARTVAAVLAFQLDYNDINDDGVYGEYTDAKLRKVLSNAPIQSISYMPCNDETWHAFEKIIDVITGGVVYGPGRGLFHNGKFVATTGPGGLGLRHWVSPHGVKPSFHCSSWTNFVLGWLGRRNEDYTHAGNIPELFDLVTQSPMMHTVPQDGWTLSYRGYGDLCFKLMPDGSGARRTGVGNYFDARELLARRMELPTFMICGQSTHLHGVWKWWHHTVLFVQRDDRLYRIAADGYAKAGSWWSGHPLRWTEITDKNVATLDGAIYQVYGVRSNDGGSYGNTKRPIAEVVIET